MKKYLLLAFIVIIAIFLRFYQLGSNPPSLAWDEAAWGYNAYSLGIDGRDEFGNFLPLQYLESFGDFKPPVYAYLAILPVKIFGLNEFAVRFPSALFGVLTVLITYFLVKRIFSSQDSPPRSLFGHLGGVAKRFPRGETVALLSAFFLAISPWHINLSRAAFEANIATFFIVGGVWLFLKGIQKKRSSLIFSVIFFVLAMYTFNTARIVAPLLVLILAIGFRKRLLERRKDLILTVIVGLMLIAPLAQFLVTPQAKLRFQEVNIFSDAGIIERANQQIANDGDAWWSKILHNRRLAFTVEYLRHYLDNLNPGFLFIKGDGNPKFSTQDVGQLYLWELPFLITGALLLIKKREGSWWIVPLWLVIGIIPAGTARETPHALRIETTLPTFQILSAIGVVAFTSWINKIKMAKNFKFLILIFISSLLIFNFLYYYHGYYTHYPREYSGEWQYGYKEAIAYVDKVKQDYDKIVFTEALGRPYIYTLFYTKEDPRTFRETAQIFREVYGFVHVKSYGKYIFTKEVREGTFPGKRILYVDKPEGFPNGANKLKTIFQLDGKETLIVYSL